MIIFQNMEAEKQVKFFQNCVAAAFAERDQSIIEVEQSVLCSFGFTFLYMVIYL